MSSLRLSPLLVGVVAAVAAAGIVVVVDDGPTSAPTSTTISLTTTSSTVIAPDPGPASFDASICDQGAVVVVVERPPDRLFRGWLSLQGWLSVQLGVPVRSVRSDLCLQPDSASTSEVIELTLIGPFPDRAAADAAPTRVTSLLPREGLDESEVTVVELQPGLELGSTDERDDTQSDSNRTDSPAGSDPDDEE